MAKYLLSLSAVLLFCVTGNLLFYSVGETGRENYSWNWLFITTWGMNCRVLRRTWKHCSWYWTKSSFSKWRIIHGMSLRGLQRGITASWAECINPVYKTPHWTSWGLRITPHFGWEGSGEARHLFFCVDDSPFCYHWLLMWTACINQLIFFFLRGCRLGGVTWLYGGSRPVPGTDNNAPHWSSHTDTAPYSASFQGRTSWKNAKHPGNPRGALAARHRSNKFVDLRGLTCHLLL